MLCVRCGGKFEPGVFSLEDIAEEAEAWVQRHARCDEGFDDGGDPLLRVA